MNKVAAVVIGAIAGILSLIIGIGLLAKRITGKRGNKE